MKQLPNTRPLGRWPLKQRDLLQFIADGEMAILPCDCREHGCAGLELTADDDRILASLN